MNTMWEEGLRAESAYRREVLTEAARRRPTHGRRGAGRTGRRRRLRSLAQRQVMRVVDAVRARPSDSRPALPGSGSCLAA